MKKEDIEHLATLARIELKEGEADTLAREITNILGYVSDINEITGNSELTKRVGALHTVLREDGEPHEAGEYTEALLNAAPERKGQYIQVKKILEDK